MPISSGQTTTIRHEVDSTEIVKETEQTAEVYYDEDGDGVVDDSCTTQTIDTVYLREDHPSHALIEKVVWEDDYVNCPPK